VHYLCEFELGYNCHILKSIHNFINSSSNYNFTEFIASALADWGSPEQIEAAKRNRLPDSMFRKKKLLLLKAKKNF